MVNQSVIQQKLEQDLSAWRSFGRYSDSSISGVRADALVESLFKKFEDDPADDASAKAIQKFLDCNTECHNFKLEPKSLFHEDVIKLVRTSLYDQFYQMHEPIVLPDGRCGDGYTPILTQHSIYMNACVGPGASVDVKSPNFFTKMYDSTLSCTDGRLYELYRGAISYNPSLVRAESARAQRWGTGIVSGSNLSTVPKTHAIDRVICTEPPLNLFFQLGIGSVIDQLCIRHHNIRQKRVSGFSIQQHVNRTMARVGSVSGIYSTIDLSSASDRISTELCRQILPPDVFGWLMLARCQCTRLPDGTQVELGMISSMGNGFTFPLQTLIFAAIVRSVYDVMGIKPVTSGPNRNYAVNGDDIIVLTDAYAFTCSCLELFGFKVNDDKSFSTGHFRESCGGDYFRGHNVRGVYIRSLKQQQSVYSSINRLNQWSDRTGIPLPATIEALTGLIGNAILYVPPDCSDTAGWKVPAPPDWFKRNANGSVVYYYHKPLATSIDVNGRWPYKVSLNYEGLKQAALGGYLRNHRISVRPQVVKYQVVTGVSPNWGYTIPQLDPS